MAENPNQTTEALVCVQPGKLALQELLLSPAPAGFVMVRPRRVGICGTDYHIYEGKHPFLEYPRVMGHELAIEALEDAPSQGVRAGQIYAVNPYLSCGSCIACRAGKPNCCTRISVLGVHQDGGMARLLAVPPQNLIAAEGLSADQCAAVEFLAIGAHAVRRGAVGAADTVLVVGAGPIGLGAALFAKISGGRVSLFDRDGERARAIAELLGVEAIVAGDDPAAAIADVTHGDGFNVVFDATGQAKAMERGFDFVAAGGRYVLVSVVKDRISFSDADFHRREMTLLGSRNATAEDFQRVIAAIRGGQVPLARIVTHRTSLAGAVHDLARWSHDKSGLIKAMIEID